jgi:hypothetical protein
MSRLPRLWADYSLSLTLTALFLLTAWLRHKGSPESKQD